MLLDFEQLWEKLINGDESTEIEAKRGEDVGKSILETISAFANEPDNGGGYFLLGIVKKENALFPDYQIIGVSDPDKVQTTLATVCRDSMQPPLRPTIWTETLDGKTVVLAYIAEAQPHEKPVFIKSRGIMNGAYRRIGSTDQKCTDEDIAFLVQNRGHQSFDKTILQQTTIDDFEPRAIQEYRNIRTKVNPNASELSLSDAELLDALGATEMQNDKRCATVAGILLFGKQTALRKHFPMTRVDYIRVPGREWLSDADQRLDLEMREALLLLIPRLINQILDDIPKGVFFSENSPIREDVPLVPLRAIREAVVNALMHRNYRTDKTVMIIRYSNRLELHNPGYSLIAEEKLGEPHATQARNPRIADVLHDLNLAETKGTGIRKIRELMEKANLTLPLFESDRAKDGFTASLFTVHFFEQSDIDWLTNFKDCGLKDEEARALVFVNKTGIINNLLYRELNRGIDTLEASRALQRLRDLELIETRSKGAGTYYVTGKRMWQAEGITSPLSASNPTDKTLSVELNPTDNVSIPGLPVHISEAVDKLGQRATADEIKYVIKKLCGWRAIQAAELAAILKRSQPYIQEKYLRPMIRSGELRYTYPDNSAHPHQAYKAASKSKKK
ncbi:MAG: ATP-binding protein [Pyrinomonadaceae bacterium]